MASTPLHKSVTLRCDQAHAFRTWVERIDLWWPPGHRTRAGSTMALEGHPGGHLVERGPDGERFTFGQVRAWEPPTRMTLAWFPGTGERRPTEVEITFTAIEDGARTRVDVVHRVGAPLAEGEWPVKVKVFERSWTHVLEALREAIAREASP